tara:strand:+ start:528 stop:1652 length:1125 start_codon:yes stop_codon:yes gene_type:complete
MKAGLVLTGGGARGAYQAGVLKGIAAICKNKRNPFSVLAGTSAGAISSAFLAAQSTDFHQGANELAELWESIAFDDIFSTRFGTLARTGFKWIYQTSMNSETHSPANYLLDTSPLGQFLEKKINFKNIENSIQNKNLSGIAISTTNYLTGTEIVFYNGDDKIQDWIRSNRISRKVSIGIEHIMASSAIPVFFPPIKLEDSFYGDGAIRMRNPLSPAIHLGAKKILAIGVRQRKTRSELLTMNEGKMNEVHLSNIAGVLLNGLFLDSLEADVERLSRINRTLETTEVSSDGLQKIDCLYISPSEDLAAHAEGSLQRFPRTLRYLLSGIGSNHEGSLDLISCLAFEKEYTKSVIELGVRDAMNHKEKIEAFLLDSQ